MAYSVDGFQRVGLGGGLGTQGSVRSVYSYVTNDTLATVLADGYFDAVDFAKADPLKAGDLIMCAHDIDGTPGGCTLVVTVGGSDVTVIKADGLAGVLTTLDSAAEEGPAYGVVKLTDTLSFALANPIPGVAVTIVAGDSATNDIIPTDTDVLLDYTGNRKATFDALDEALTLLGVSETQFVVVSNVGSVTLGAS